MNPNSDELQQNEAIIKSAHEQIALGTALEKLYSNREFKKIIIDDYLTREAVRLTHLLASPAIYTTDKREAVVNDLLAISTFNQFLQHIERNAEQAKRALAEAEATREELIQEEMNG